MIRPVHPRTLMVDRLLPAQALERRVHELGSVVGPEAFDAVTDVGQDFLRRRGHVGRALALQGVDLSHACCVILDQDYVQPPPGRHDLPGAGKVDEGTVQAMLHPRGICRRQCRTPTLRLHAPIAGDQGSSDLDALLLGRLA